MEENKNIPNTSDFSGIPSLGDAQGLENYLNNQALAAQGLPVQPTEPAAQPAPQGQPAPTGTPAPAVDPAAITPTAPAATGAQTPAPAQGGNGETITLTREQLANLIASTLRQQQQGQAPAQAQKPAQPAGYTAEEQAFITKALAQGYNLQDINNFLVNRRNNGINPAYESRIAKVEEYLKTQEYKNAETAFINKLNDFGNKWGLSEQDLVTFGNEALKQGINIAMGNVNLETVFRAVYPEQYAIRAQRMTPTNSSQIYGGNSIPEGSRASAAKLEDAYVEGFLKSTMPNQYGMLNKK